MEGSPATASAWSCVIGKVRKPVARSRDAINVAGARGSVSFPRLCLTTISQATAAETYTSFEKSSIAFLASFESSAGILVVHKKMCVSSKSCKLFDTVKKGCDFSIVRIEVVADYDEAGIHTENAFLRGVVFDQPRLRRTADGNDYFPLVSISQLLYEPRQMRFSLVHVDGLAHALSLAWLVYIVQLVRCER
jgi:hypothetical protein